MKMPDKPEVVRLRRSGRWVVWGCPWPDVRVCGPYKTRADALHGEGGLSAIKKSIRDAAEPTKARA